MPRLRKLLILLAPLAAVLGAYLAWRDSTPARLQLAVTRTQVVQLARAQAAANGVNTDGWRALVDLKPDNTLRHYLTRTATPAQRNAIERVLAPIPYRCILVHPDRAEDSVRITVAPNGRLITYRVPPIARATVSESVARAAAEAELARRLGPDRAGFTFTGSGEKRHETSASTVRQFTFEKQYAPELAIKATVGISGANVIEFSVTPSIAPSYTARFPEFSTALTGVRGATILLIVLGGMIYVIARFVRRLREHEIPLQRTLIVSVFVFFAFLGSTFVSGVGQQIDAIEKGAGTPASMQLTMTIVISAIMGALLGMTWGACEADLREAYPEKLTSIDALLGGHFSTRAVRSSVAIGIVLGAYSALLSGLEPLLRLPRSWAAVAEDIAPYQTTYPALGLVLFGFVGLPITLGLLFTAVSATHRRGPTRNATIVLTIGVLAFFFLTTLGNHSPIAWSLVTAIIAAAVLLVPFFAGDVVALIFTVLFSFWLTGAAALIAQPSPSLRAGGWALLAGVIVVLGTGGVAGLRKRDEPDVVETERPEYARNIAERIMLRSEMDAARQAQLRVMPRIVPTVEGVQLAAKHSASAEIGSDYFEFFPSPTHIAVAIADARLPGLSSALCVSMLKGLLLNYAARLTDTRDVADRVYRQLATIFGDDLPVSFFFGHLDRATGAFSFATFGTAPRAVVVRAGNAISLEGEEYVDLARSDALVIYTARLADLHNRDGAAIGNDTLHRELSTARSDPQTLVDALFELATRHSRGVATPQSWVAVAMTRPTS
ncbi:MAG: PP2C family protein-serine/threonine phosphatase [Thermoanaerobaculia bacterium]